MYAVCASDTYTYINPYVCYMCFRYMHICTGRITDGGVGAAPDVAVIFHWLIYPGGSHTAHW